MSVASDYSLHPLLRKFYDVYTERFPQAEGLILEENTGKPVAKIYRLVNSFFVCCSTIKWDIETQIIIAGSRLNSSYRFSGSSLFAARVVELKVPKMNLVGTKAFPVTIVALESLSLHATVVATIKHLTICLFKGAKLNLEFESMEECENITLYSADIVAEKIVLYCKKHWKTAEDLYGFAEDVEAINQEEVSESENTSKNDS